MLIPHAILGVWSTNDQLLGWNGLFPSFSGTKAIWRFLFYHVLPHPIYALNQQICILWIEVFPAAKLTNNQWMEQLFPSDTKAKYDIIITSSIIPSNQASFSEFSWFPMKRFSIFRYQPVSRLFLTPNQQLLYMFPNGLMLFPLFQTHKLAAHSRHRSCLTPKSQQPLSESTPQSFRKKFAERIPVASAVVVEELRHHGIAQLPSAIAVGLQDDTEIFETLCMVTGARPAEPGDSKLDLPSGYLT